MRIYLAMELTSLPHTGLALGGIYISNQFITIFPTNRNETRFVKQETLKMYGNL
jgi:hypothetical protein